MILGTAFFIKVVLTLACGFGIFWLLREKTAKRYTAVLLALITVAVGAFLGQKVSELVPPLTDTVTITALNERSADSSGTGVLLSGYTVDDQFYAIDSPAEGKWFWNGNRLMWRSTGSASTPDGLTQTIQIAVPVGWSRTIDFAGDKWKGLASVQFGGEEQTVDLYVSKSAAIPVEIGRSESGRLILNQVRYLAVYAAVILCLSGAVAVLLRWWLRDPDKGKAWFNNHFWIVYLLIAIVSFFYMVSYAGEEGFWQDELATIESCLSNRSFLEILFVTHTSFYPTAVGAITKLWYQIAPYGEQWLLLPIILFTACGSFFTALAAEKIRNRRTATAAAIFTAACYPIIYNVGYELRVYGYLYCAAAAMLYLFMAKNERLTSGKPALKYEIWFGFWTWIAATSHVFGVFYACLLFVVDAILWINKKVKLRFSIPYIAAAVLYLPWVYNMFCYDVFSMSASFQAAPSLELVKSLLKRLSGNWNFTYYLFLLGVLFVVIHAIRNRHQRTGKVYAPLVLSWLMAGLIGFIYFYGTVINTEATMWNIRYFCVLYPAAAILIVIAVDEVLTLVQQKTVREGLALLLAGVFVATSHSALIKNVSVERQTYRDAGDWFYTQVNTVYREDTLIIFGGHRPNGWSEYHLTEQGRRDPLNVIKQTRVNHELLENYNTVYVYYEHRDCTSRVTEMIEEQFELIETDKDLKIRTYVRKDAE